METIKIGKNTYTIQSGDYINFNGNVFLFCSGDGRTLRREKWSDLTYVTLGKKNIKEIPFEDLRKQKVLSMGVHVTRWYFP